MLSQYTAQLSRFGHRMNASTSKVRGRGLRPLLEVLEDRAVPSSFTLLSAEGSAEWNLSGIFTDSYFNEHHFSQLNGADISKRIYSTCGTTVGGGNSHVNTYINNNIGGGEPRIIFTLSGGGSLGMERQEFLLPSANITYEGNASGSATATARIEPGDGETAGDPVGVKIVIQKIFSGEASGNASVTPDRYSVPGTYIAHVGDTVSASINYNVHLAGNISDILASRDIAVALFDVQFILVPPPKIQIDVNDTPDKSDNITLFNPPFLAQPYTQMIPARITNRSASTQTIQLSTSSTGTGAVTLSRTTVTLPAGASTEVTVTPRADSFAPNDVHIIALVGGTQVAKDDMTVVRVTIPQHINADDTPSGMPDRIPPRVNTPKNVRVEPILAGSGQSVTLAIAGQSPTNGEVSINGSPTPADLTYSSQVDLRGTAQTAPGGHYSNLALVIRVRGQDTIRSAGFSVSAIPVDFRQIAVRRLAHGVLAFSYAWDSDSHVMSDLNQVWVGEYVTNSDGGIHVGAGRPWRGNATEPTIRPARVPGGMAVTGVAQDRHLPPGRRLPTAGPADTLMSTQYYGFHDFRTDSRPADNSLGWQINLLGPITIQRSVWNLGTPAAPLWQYTIRKSGQQSTTSLR